MRSRVWDNVDRKLRCLRAGRAEVNEAQKFLLANEVETYLKLNPEDEERFAAEIRRDANKEVRDMVITWEDALAASHAKGMETGRLQGREQGLEQGLQRGIQQGEASVLRRLLSRRFPQLPRWVDERLEGAAREELESWAERVLDARRLEDVFGSD